MQNAALLWHVSLLVSPEKKGLALGLVGLVKVVPIVAFSMISGVVADAWNRRRLMLITQTGSALVAAGLAFLAFRGITAVWPMYALAGLGAAVGAFDLPARQALVPTLVPREHLPNAISLNTIMFQTASVVGPSIGGVLIAVSGVGWAYAANAVSFLFVIVALADDARHPEARAVRGRIARRRVVARGARRAAVRVPLAADPIDDAARFLRDVLLVGDARCCRSSRRTSCRSAPGATAGCTPRRRRARCSTSAVMVPLAERIERRGQTLLWAVGGFGLATVVFGLSRSFWLTCVCLAMTGATDTVSMVIRNIVRQLETPDRLRGRMTGVNMVFFMGGPQLGEFEAGALANWLGAVFSVVSGGVGCLVATGWVAWSTPDLRHYRSLRSTSKKYGNAMAESAAAVPNAAEKPNL